MAHSEFYSDVAVHSSIADLSRVDARLCKQWVINASSIMLQLRRRAWFTR